MSLPDIPNVVSTEELIETAEAIIDWQLPNGMIPWFPGGHSDPWNHVEAAMALAVTGHLDEAENAYLWLKENQLPNGAWHHYYLAKEIEDPKYDSNVVAYVATGVWHHWLITHDRGFLETMWSVVEPAIDFVLSLQTPRGEIIWAMHPDGTPWSYALLTGSASICHSLRCAISTAEELGHERPDWELSLANLAHMVKKYPSKAFAPKERWAMDWYYPVLSGVVSGDQGKTLLSEKSDIFIMEDKGVKCVSDQPWITTAETCECAIAYLIAEDTQKAESLFLWSQDMRQEDGHYLTGVVHPAKQSFPEAEKTTYSSAAVILAADAISQSSPASGIFTGKAGLPEIIDTEEHILVLD